jgi:integrase
MLAADNSRHAAATSTPPLLALLGFVDAAPIIAKRLADYASAARGAYASATEKAIRCDTAVFTAWCGRQGLAALLASPQTVAAFLDAMAETRAVATVRRYVSSIASMHRAAGVPDPTKDERQTVRLALRRIARAKGTRQRQASPVNYPVLVRLLACLGRSTRAVRDAALLSLAYDTLARRSELVALDVEHIRFAEDGTGAVLIARSKTDQEGAGMVRFIAADTVERVRAWLRISGATAGPLLPAVGKGGRIGGRLSADDVARVVKRAARAAGMPASGISGHSTRVGACQDLTAMGASLPEVMQAGGWKSPAMPARYGEHLVARRGAMAKLAAQQRRA